MIRNVTEASLTVHRPDPARSTGAAVIVCPGGSFVALTIENATAVAQRLTRDGVTALVLSYRLLPSPVRDDDFARGWPADRGLADIKAQSLIAAEDAVRAVRTVRERAGDWDVDPARVGMLGFSAGGLLTIGAATSPDAAGRPDTAAAIYGPTWHEYAVPALAPPLFLSFATDDESPDVVAGNLALYNAWRAAGHSAEMHVYARGGHGFAMEPRGLPCDGWRDRYVDWLRSRDFLG